ncbi:MAG: type II secretion system protein, partial [Candidatus Caccosoma sp.]|nr:type II secretion system protein [Candidatus Caccosoma sp.]
MRKKIKKAFTLVELLVVIAILAILATVSIVGYNSFTKKARVSNDTALVSQLNTILKADSMVNGNAKTPTDALKLTEEAGYDVEKLTPTATGYQIIWNQETSQFALLDEKDNVVYGDKNTDEYKNWKFVSEYSSATNYSVYLKGTSFTSVPEIHAGIDTGKNTKITAINYKNSGAKENVV